MTKSLVPPCFTRAPPTHPPPTHKKLSNDECPFTDMSVYLCSRCRRGEVTCLLSTWSRCMCLCCSWCNATVGESISVRWSHTTNTSTERASTRARRQLSPCGLIFKTRPHTRLCIGDSLVFLDLLSLEYECGNYTGKPPLMHTCISQHGCPSIWPWNELKCPVTPVPVSHNSKHHQQCRHLYTHTPLSSKCIHLLPDPLYSLFIFLFFAYTGGREPVKWVGLLSHR